MSTAEVAKWEDHLVAVMSGSRFRNKEGLIGEDPYFIYPYDPRDALEIAASKKRIKTKLAQKGIEVLEVNLYDLVVEVLQERGVWDDLIELEPTISKDDFREGLRSMLDPGDDLAPAIRAKLAAQAFDIFFLTGIGEVFPFIRSHSVLNNLQTVAGDKPMLMFFPGSYEQSKTLGSSLVLFGSVPDDNYYRAKDIREQEA
ncbi:DUF1788 domain-containing protein [Microbacterium kunmingense]|uniref:DUF1788 domain-containing protein n=1 Tax=Microbacterium kunmingense TaxID=2915939 RepID=UPI003D7538C7